jgi:hypothetical protein
LHAQQPHRRSPPGRRDPRLAGRPSQAVFARFLCAGELLFFPALFPTYFRAIWCLLAS